MGLSAGGFFKNFVKGAAQQYNTNIAYVEQQKIEEERAKKKEERQFGYDKRLKEMEYGLKVDVEKAKSEGNKSYLGRYPMKNGKMFSIPMMAGYKSLADKTAKYESAFKAYSPHIPNLDTLKKELTDTGYQNLLSSIVKNYKGMSTVDDGSVQGTEAKVIYDSNYYKNMKSNDDLFETFSREIGMDVENLKKYIQYNNNNEVVLAQKPTLKTNRFGSPELTIPGFYGAGEDKPFNAEDIQIAATSILNTGSDKEVIAWMNTKHDFMKSQEIKGVTFNGSDLIKGIASAKKAVGTLDLREVTELTPEVGKTIRRAIMNMPNGFDMANDPQVMHEIIKNAMPKKRNPKLMQIAGGPVQYNNESFLTRVFGKDKGKVLINSAQKSEKSGVRLARAKEMIALLDAGAGTGLASRWEATGKGIIQQGKQLISRMVGFKSGENQFDKDALNNLGTKLESVDSKLSQTNDSKQRDQIILDALLEYETTLMVFDIATMAQDAGGGLDSNGGAVRLSDGDVKLSSGALQKTLFQNPESTKIIAQKIAELAEQETFIYSMLSRGTIEDAQAGLIMMDVYRGELGSLIQSIRPNRVHETLGVEKVTTPKFVFNPNININKDKVTLPKDIKNEKKLKTQ